MSAVDEVRLRELLQEMHVAAAGTPDLERLHAAEDEAASILGLRTTRMAPADVVSACQLYEQVHARLRSAAAVARPAKPLPEGIQRVLVSARTSGTKHDTTGGA